MRYSNPRVPYENTKANTKQPTTSDMIRAGLMRRNVLTPEARSTGQRRAAGVTMTDIRIAPMVILTTDRNGSAIWKSYNVVGVHCDRIMISTPAMNASATPGTTPSMTTHSATGMRNNTKFRSPVRSLPNAIIPNCE